MKGILGGRKRPGKFTGAGMYMADPGKEGCTVAEKGVGWGQNRHRTPERAPAAWEGLRTAPLSRRQHEPL